jgi:hypothetical protein
MAELVAAARKRPDSARCEIPLETRYRPRTGTATSAVGVATPALSGLLPPRATVLASGLWRSALLVDLQVLHVQPLDLEVLDPQLADHRTADRQTPDRQGTDGTRTNRRRPGRDGAEANRADLTPTAATA